MTTITAMGLLDGKNIVITGVLTDASLAFGVAALAQQEGASIVLTGAGRALSLTERVARKLPEPVDVFELDVTVPEHLENVRAALDDEVGPRRWRAARDRLRAGGVPRRRLHGTVSGTTSSVALHISAYSLKALADAFAPLMTNGGSFVGLDFDNTVAWPAYNWMGVSKSALESISRYLAVALGGRGIRSNLVAAGPGQDHGRQEHPRLQEVRGHLGRSRPAGLGRHRLVRRRQGVHRAAQRLVPGDDGRDHPRRRRLSRHRRLITGGLLGDLLDHQGRRTGSRAAGNRRDRQRLRVARRIPHREDGVDDIGLHEHIHDDVR